MQDEIAASLVILEVALNFVPVPFAGEDCTNYLGSAPRGYFKQAILRWRGVITPPQLQAALDVIRSLVQMTMRKREPWSFDCPLPMGLSISG